MTSDYDVPLMRIAIFMSIKNIGIKKIAPLI